MTDAKRSAVAAPSSGSHTGASTSTSPEAVSARVGFVGAGQLARMTQRAAIDLGVRLEVLAANVDDPAALAGAVAHIGSADDLEAVRAFASRVDVLTLDHELVDAGLLERIVEDGHLVRPSPSALRYAQDKLYARREFAARGLPTPAFAEVQDPAAAEEFGDKHGWPVVMKQRSGGYDGRGVVVAHDAEQMAEILAGGGSWLVEEHVAIAVELAVVIARRPDGEARVYPVVETVQRDGICVELVMPARVDDDVAARAGALAERIAREVDAVGIIAVELFVTSSGDIQVNELAVRPHNSGHATIEASDTSQFHNHLRAVLGWPLGSTAMRAPASVVVNLLGGERPTSMAERLPLALADDRVHVHLYGKEWRPGRKLGHVTAIAEDPAQALDAARAAATTLMVP